VVDVEVAAAFAWKQKGRVALLADVLQGVEGACLERHRSQAGVGLRPLEHSFREGAPHVDDATVAIEVALLERDPLGRSQPSRGGEDRDQRSFVEEPSRDHAWPLSLRVFLCIGGWLGVVGYAVSEVDAWDGHCFRPVVTGLP
jgi:hypothetical protein